MPPVTALRSPPDSRITGALSPVITDSSTLAIPSMTSPSPGITSFGSHRQMSSLRRDEDGTIWTLPSAVSFLASESDLVFRRLSACAFPRPSAIASAKLAKRTVNHSHAAICVSKSVPCEPPNAVLSASPETRMAPTSTTSITGFLARVRGLSLTNESKMARFARGGSNKGLGVCMDIFVSLLASSAATGSSARQLARARGPGSR